MSDHGFVGRQIVKVRPLTHVEMDREGWDSYQGHPLAIVLDDGTMLFPSRDEEGNGPGVFFGLNPNGTGFGLLAVSGWEGEE